MSDRRNHDRDGSMRNVIPTLPKCWRHRNERVQRHAGATEPKESEKRQYTHMSPMQFYAYKLMIREPFNPVPHSAGYLFQQYIVDAYCKAEARRLGYTGFPPASCLRLCV